MLEAIAIIAIIGGFSVAAWSQWQLNLLTQKMNEAERARVADWWKRSQSHIDNLQDRVMAKEWEVYAQATTVERPSDQPTYTAEGELLQPGMVRDLAEQIIRNQREAGYDDYVPDIAEDYAPGPIVG